MSAQAHTSDPHILDRRTLARDHRRLAALLRPGMTVLDVGCGTGAVTADIARAVGPWGTVVGIDRDPTLLQRARERHAGVPGLRFEEADVLALPAAAAFDVVTAARVLQWIARPEQALGRMVHATRAGGLVVALEYNHADLVWDPEPPVAVRRFYDAFLGWRAANGWDNRMAHRLPGLFADAGLVGVEASVEDEVAARGDAGFDDALAIWQRVIVTMGPSIVDAGTLTATAVDAAATAYGEWCRDSARVQHMVLHAVAGRKPASGRS
jgi:SAM-dependent methyltransferase